MLGNLAISMICGRGLRRHRGDPRRPVRARSGRDRGDPGPDSQHRGHDRRHPRRDRRALGQPCSVRRLPDRDRRLPADRELRPAAHDHRKGGTDLRLHRARAAFWPSERSSGSSGRSSACRSRPASRSWSRSSPPPGERASPRRTLPRSWLLAVPTRPDVSEALPGQAPSPTTSWQQEPIAWHWLGMALRHGSSPHPRREMQ